jgi:hypothetical protein
MTQIEIVDGRLKVEILGWDKIWALKSRLEFPLEHVAGVRRWDKAKDGAWWVFRGFRAPGTNLPGVIIAGTYHRKGEHVFYDVHDFDHTIVIELKDEWYARLVVQMAEPEAMLRLIPSAQSDFTQRAFAAG